MRIECDILVRTSCLETLLHGAAVQSFLLVTPPRHIYLDILHAAPSL